MFSYSNDENIYLSYPNTQGGAYDIDLLYKRIYLGMVI